MSRASSLALVAVGAVLAACADSSRTTAPAVSPESALANSSELADAPQNRHLFLTRGASNAAKPGGGSNTGIVYHGGPLLTAATNVAAIYWASGTIYNGGPAAGTTGSGAQDGSLIGFFLNHLGGSAYFNINTTYYNGSNVHVANVVNYTQFYANNVNAPSGTQSVSDAQMVAMLQSAFDGGKLSYDPNTLYHIFTAGAVNLGGGFGTQYCAYHTHGTVTINGVAKTVLYSAMPYDYAHASACSNGTAAPNGDPGADAEVNTLAHETEETTTDLMGNAWFDRRGYENADKCAWTWGTTYNNGTGVANMNIGGKDFLVQQNWKNSGSGGCAMHL